MGETLALSQENDFLILDVVIPDITGFELYKKIRNRNNLTPVIILTSLDTVEDKITGFECGADDYLTKPFSFQEFFARIKAISRRRNIIKVSSGIKILDLSVDPMSKKVSRNKKEICLTTTGYKILELLMSNKNKVLRFRTVHFQLSDLVRKNSKSSSSSIEINIPANFRLFNV
jgi:two-component system copper resistance phosphate regulon response regulator CusR